LIVFCGAVVLLVVQGGLDDDPQTRGCFTAKTLWGCQWQWQKKVAH